MLINSDLMTVIIVRATVLALSATYLFYQWKKAPRRYVSDLPFQMGVSFAALAAAKVLDIFLYSTFLGEPKEALLVWNPAMPIGWLRWLLILVSSVPLVSVNLRIWLPEHPRFRAILLLIYAATFAGLILSTSSYAALNALLPYIVVPAAVLTVVTFLFVYRQRRLPGVYSLLVAIGWLAYIITQAVRPTLMAIGPAPWGLVTVAELLDMAAWIVIFLGFVLKPPFARHHNMPKTPDAEEPAILAPQTT